MPGYLHVPSHVLVILLAEIWDDAAWQGFEAGYVENFLFEKTCLKRKYVCKGKILVLFRCFR